MVESTVVLSTFLMLVLGMLDFALVVLNRNNLETAACRLARAAIVRGEKASKVIPAWGPNEFNGRANDGSEAGSIVTPYLAVMRPADVRIRLEWLDGSTATGRRVRATLRYDHRPLVAGFLGIRQWELSASSTMRIQH